MTYQQTISWLFAQLPNYQLQGSRALFKNLDNITKFCDHIGHPQNNYPSIHVAGTNGKGSTSHMLSSVMQNAGYKVGLYTSPHLKDFRERIRINGTPISESEVIDFVACYYEYLSHNSLSFFELTVAMAFESFSKHNVDIAVIEVGLGGRLDATNIILPILSIITNIGMDHSNLLGNNLTDIAFEKAGIIKPRIPVVVGQFNDETKSVFEHVAAKQKAKIYFASDFKGTLYTSDLKGLYQQYNARTVCAAINQLQSLGWKVTEQNLSEGLKSVVTNTNLLGRWQNLSVEPDIYCDVAHNADGFKVLFEHLNTETFNRLYIVFGVMKDKDLDAILPLLSPNATYFCCAADNKRALSSQDLCDKLLEKGFKAISYGAVESALNAAKTVANTDDLIVICGSNFVVSEII